MGIFEHPKAGRVEHQHSDLSSAIARLLTLPGSGASSAGDSFPCYNLGSFQFSDLPLNTLVKLQGDCPT